MILALLWLSVPGTALAADAPKAVISLLQMHGRYPEVVPARIFQKNPGLYKHLGPSLLRLARRFGLDHIPGTQSLLGCDGHTGGQNDFVSRAASAMVGLHLNGELSERLERLGFDPHAVSPIVVTRGYRDKQFPLYENGITHQPEGYPVYQVPFGPPGYVSKQRLVDSPHLLEGASRVKALYEQIGVPDAHVSNYFDAGFMASVLGQSVKSGWLNIPEVFIEHSGLPRKVPEILQVLKNEGPEAARALVSDLHLPTRFEVEKFKLHGGADVLMPLGQVQWQEQYQHPAYGGEIHGSPLFNSPPLNELFAKPATRADRRLAQEFYSVLRARLRSGGLRGGDLDRAMALPIVVQAGRLTRGKRPKTTAKAALASPEYRKEVVSVLLVDHAASEKAPQREIVEDVREFAAQRKVGPGFQVVTELDVNHALLHAVYESLRTGSTFISPDPAEPWGMMFAEYGLSGRPGMVGPDSGAADLLRQKGLDPCILPAFDYKRNQYDYAQVADALLNVARMKKNEYQALGGALKAAIDSETSPRVVAERIVEGTVLAMEQRRDGRRPPEVTEETIPAPRLFHYDAPATSPKVLNAFPELREAKLFDPDHLPTRAMPVDLPKFSTAANE